MGTTTLDFRQKCSVPINPDGSIPYDITDSDKKLADAILSQIDIQRRERNLRDLGLM